MTTISRHAWRVALVISGILLVNGGRLHPSADAEDDLRTELATMTADDRWVPGHTLIVVSTVFLALGLWLAYRGRVWPEQTRRPLLFGAVAITVYILETLAHLGAAIDHDALARGDSPPIAMAHVGLSIVLYPITGWAIIFMAHAFGRAWGGWRRVIAGLGVVSGFLMAFSVPTTLILPDAEVSFMFAGAALTLAVFSMLTAAVGAPRRTSAGRAPSDALTAV